MLYLKIQSSIRYIKGEIIKFLTRRRKMIVQRCVDSFNITLNTIVIGCCLLTKTFTIAADDCQCGPCQSVGMSQNTLLRVDQVYFGGPVRSVAWLCNDCGKKGDKAQFVAVGGHSKHQKDVCIYKLAPMDSLKKVIRVEYGAFVLALDWCCINDVAYLAVAGAADDNGDNVKIFRFESEPKPKLIPVASFNNHANVYAVSWLCIPCMQDKSKRYLAIGGNEARNDHADIRLLCFDATEEKEQLIETSSKIHGAPIYSLDWCIQEGRCPLLAAGGKSSKIECDDLNIRIFALDCELGNLVPRDRSITSWSCC